jgi:small conductance mechanosensitive channel
MIYQEYFNNPSIQAFLLATLFIYFIFRLFQYLNKRFVIKQNHKKNLRKFIYFLEFITWIFYVFESIKYFAENNNVLAGALAIILFVIIGWTAWFVVKDYVAGLYLKWNDTYKVNEVIEIGGQAGRIIKLGSRNVILEISPLHTINVSYSKLFTEQVIKTGLTDLSANTSFTINLSKEFQNSDSHKVVRNYILQLPWTNLKHEPLVIVENQEKDEMTIRISASLIDESYSEQFSNTIRTKFE